MSILFDDIGEFKKCVNTLIEEEGLLDKRNFKLHENFNNIDFNKINLDNSYYLIGQNNNQKNKFIFIYFINTSGFLSKTYKNKIINILDCKKYIE